VSLFAKIIPQNQTQLRHTLSLLWPYVLIVVLTLLFFYKLAFTGMILARGDMYAYFYPYWAVRNAALMAGQIPLWTPDIFMGAPLLANSQIGLFYPPNWILTPLDAPTAITISLLLHVIWAVMGAYRLARATLGLDQLPALVAAAVFGLGGYMGAKVENINQFQALAWMPWLFLVLNYAVLTPNPPTPFPRIQGKGERKYFPNRHTLRYGLLLGISIALQLLAGHPQTVFITAVGLGIYAITATFSGWARRGLSLPVRGVVIGRAILILACAGIIGVILASPQLIPTLELSRASNRSGGLLPQQAMAFSLNPWIIGRGLMPSYDSLIFGEYLAYVGVIGMGLAVVGIFNGYMKADLGALWQRGAHRLPWIVLVAVGFGLALGLYNPLYWTLASLPGFSFFRVPARWLALFALAAGLLAGIGLQSLTVRRPRWWVFALIGGLIAALGQASFLADVMAMDVIGPAEPTTRTLVGWGIAAGTLLIGLWSVPKSSIHPSPQPPPRIQGGGASPSSLSRISRSHWVVSALSILALVELFAASRVLAYNEVAPPDTYTAQRFTISQLKVYAAEQTPPGRVLSISQALFDPGDIAALTARYREAGMSELAIRIALVDTKLRELVAANLPLAWGIPSVDGFDGGLLPSGDFSAFTSLMLPPGQERSVDGRLREMMAQPECGGACIPEQRWLNLTNTRYLITDKVFDLWKDDVAYDTALTYKLSADTTSVAVDPAFVATAVDVLFTADGCSPSLDCAPLLSGGKPSSVEPFEGFTLGRWELDDAEAINRLSWSATEAVSIRAITLVDTRTGAFQQVTLPPWKRVLSSDIKLYENQAVMPRAFVVHHTEPAGDTETALGIMRDPDFDPTISGVITTTPDANHWVSVGLNPYFYHSEASITVYSPEYVEIQVDAMADGDLILSDAYYPGWVATVNGELKPIFKADVMFRGVQIPEGKSTVVFEYKPSWWPGILIFGAAAWVLAAVVGLVLFRGKRASPP
jgi:hypothetical protein